jgi:HEAT repeat protein
LLLAAIEAVGNLHPQEAGEILADLSESPDREIAEAAAETIDMALAMSGEIDDQMDNDGNWIN